MNLKNETLEVLADNNKTWEDVEWVGCKKFQISKDRFLELADVEYDDGYGHPDVAIDLLVVGKDFWLERHEYDGSEWWEYKEMFSKPNITKEIKTLTNGCWSTLSELNKGE